MIRKVKNSGYLTYLIRDLNDEEVVGTFYERELQKKKKEKIKNKKILELKVINRKADKLYVKWKGCDNYFISWSDKKDIVK